MGIKFSQDLKGRMIRLTKAQWEALDAEATKKGIGKSEIMRRVVDLYLMKESKTIRNDDRLRALEQRVNELERQSMITSGDIKIDLGARVEAGA